MPAVAVRKEVREGIIGRLVLDGFLGKIARNPLEPILPGRAATSRMDGSGGETDGGGAVRPAPARPVF
jgi:hypothetical protein